MKEVCGFEDSKGKFHRTEEAAKEAEKEYLVDNLFREVLIHYDCEAVWAMNINYRNVLRNILTNPNKFLEILTKLKDNDTGTR